MGVIPSNKRGKKINRGENKLAYFIDNMRFLNEITLVPFCRNMNVYIDNY